MRNFGVDAARDVEEMEGRERAAENFLELMKLEMRDVEEMEGRKRERATSCAKGNFRVDVAARDM